MFQSFVGYIPSNNHPEVPHKPLSPCIKLVNGRKVLSICETGCGFTKLDKGLGYYSVMVARIGGSNFLCYEFLTETSAQELHNLWMPEDKRHPFQLLGEDQPKTLDAAMKWLMED